MLDFDILKNRCEDKLMEIGLASNKTYSERLSEELKIIKAQENEYKTSLYEYLETCIEKAKTKKLKNSNHLLVSYLLGITDENPIDMNLDLITTKAAEFPDIDTDFEDTKRDQVKEYIRQKYGDQNVASIIAVGKMKAKAVIKNVGRVMNIPLEEVEEATKSMDIDEPLEKAYKNNEVVKRFFDKYEYMNVYNMCLKLEGNVNHTSKHAAGLVISPVPLTDIVGIEVQKGQRVACWEEGGDRELSHVGLIKFDILGLNTLSVIKNAIRLIKQNYNIDLDINKIDRNDHKVIKIFHDAKTVGIFQFEKKWIRDLLKKIKITSLEDVSAVNALNRPGPMDMGMDTKFWKVKNGVEQPTYLHPLLKPILANTYSVILYQEQIIEICNKLAGMSLDEADDIRKILGKGKTELAKGHNPFEKHQKRFLDSCFKNAIRGRVKTERKIFSPADMPITAKNVLVLSKDVDKEGNEYERITCDIEVAEEIWAQIEAFARYGFNKAHSVEYALIAYQCAYLKCYYPKEFFASLLTLTENTENQADRINYFVEYIHDAREFKINVKPPNINKSLYQFSVDGEDILSGFCFIKGFGEKAAEEIIRKRPFTSFEDMLLKVDHKFINKSAMFALIHSGCFDDFIEVSKSKTNILRRFELVSRYQDFKSIKSKDREFVVLKYDEAIRKEAEACGEEIFNTSLDMVETKKLNEKFSIDDKIMKFDILDKIDVGTTVRLYGKVSGFFITKSDKPVAFVTVKNRKNTKKFIMFSSDIMKLRRPDNVDLMRCFGIGSIITFRVTRATDYKGEKSFAFKIDGLELINTENNLENNT
jgi:DNA polymerase-3 subunit alpha